MELTRQGYGYVVLAGAMALLTVVLSRPVLLVGVAGIVAWLLGRQWQFVQTGARTAAELTVEYTLARDHVTVEEATTVSVAVSCDVPTTLSLTVEPNPPVGTAGGDPAGRTIELDPNSDGGNTSFTVTAPTAGRHQFQPATVTMTDEAGLFETTRQVGDGPVLTVEPRRPDDVHVGEGGEQLGSFGTFRADQYGEGIDPAELREYVPGDPAGRIDWNATARLGEPHVLEFEVDTDRRTVLVVDHRSSLGTGPDGERKLDYLRQVALAFVAAARQRGQAVGLLTVGDEGVTTRLQPATSENHYDRLTRALFDLTAEEGPFERLRTPTGETVDRRSPADANRDAAVLESDDSAFGQSLRPFLADVDPYVRRIEDRPLYETVRTELGRMQGTLVTALLTDDEGRDEVREAVEAGTRGDGRTAAFLAPSVLFEQGSVTNLPAAYDRYVDFETFRREIAGQPHVEAYEVGPEARIEALLATRRGGER